MCPRVDYGQNLMITTSVSGFDDSIKPQMSNLIWAYLVYFRRVLNDMRVYLGHFDLPFVGIIADLVMV